MTPNPTTRVFSQTKEKPKNRDSAYGTNGMLEMIREYVGEEENDEVEKMATIVEGEEDLTVSVDKRVDKDLADEKKY